MAAPKAPIAPKPVAAAVAQASPFPPVVQPVAEQPPVKSRNFEIEDDIPLPVKRIGVKGESIYPFATIAVNQSFFVAATDTLKEPWKTLTSMASRLSRELHPKKFITSRMKNKDGVDGVRIWRASDDDKPLAAPRKKRVKEAAAPEVIETVAEHEAEQAEAAE